MKDQFILSACWNRYENIFDIRKRSREMKNSASQSNERRRVEWTDHLSNKNICWIRETFKGTRRDRKWVKRWRQQQKNNRERNYKIISGIFGLNFFRFPAKVTWSKNEISFGVNLRLFSVPSQRLLIAQQLQLLVSVTFHCSPTRAKSSEEKEESLN